MNESNFNNRFSSNNNMRMIDDDESVESENSTDQTNIIYANKIEEVVNKYANNPNTIITSNDTNDVEKILANEMNNCTIKDRTEIQEEIHGVHCMAPDETPELLTRSLEQLSIELDNDDHIPQDEKCAYLLSRRLQQEHELNTSYVNSIEFRSMYLRSELFDVKKAARRIVKALDFLLNIFGEYALMERKIKLSDFTKKELNLMRKGAIQLMPSRDRGGRRIIIAFPGYTYDSVASATGCSDTQLIPTYICQQKIGFYLSLVCATDIENQRKGIIYVIWTEKLSFKNMRFRNKSKMILSLLPIRIASIHFCAKDTLARNLAKAVFVARLSTELRIRFVYHFGESVENRYLLKGYGMPIDSLPITWTGTIKTENVKRFVNLRSNVENNHKEINTTNKIIECPYLNDILFKKGNHTIHQSGNFQFQSIVWSTYKQHLQQHQQKNGSINNDNDLPLTALPPVISIISTISIKSLVPDILKKIKQDNLRVLVWDNKKGWWNYFYEESDYKKHIHFGALHILKDTLSNNNNNNNLHSSSVPTSISTSKSTSTSSSISVSISISISISTSASASASETETETETILSNNNSRKQKQQVVQSSTSIFIRSQDDDGKNKRKISYINNDGDGNNNNNNKNDDDDDADGMMCNECFGMSFVPYDDADNNELK